MKKYCFKFIQSCLTVVVFLLICSASYAQSFIINTSLLEGVEISSDNIFNYQITNALNAGQSVIVKGTLRYRNSTLKLSYSFNTFLSPGVTTFTKDQASRSTWDFSEQGLKELFFQYNKLPQGTYEYCVEIQLAKVNTETPLDDPASSCVYQTVNDVFLINLVDPENDAKLHEYYPVLSWVVNYPFASELTYRIRVAEQKKGQNLQNAITRNNPVYQERGLTGTSVTYPITAKPLETFQPYAWTVDAYYKGILLGGAEVWKFTIVKDSLLKPVDVESSYVELNLEKKVSELLVPGVLKLKYIERNLRVDTLSFELYDDNGRIVKMPEKGWQVIKGDNRKVIQFHEVISLKHNKGYRLNISNSSGEQFIVPFRYLNPLFLK
jgi:hypothetical protein